MLQILADEEYELETGERSDRRFRWYMAGAAVLTLISLALPGGFERPAGAPQMAAGIILGFGLGYALLRWRMHRQRRRLQALHALLPPDLPDPLPFVSLAALIKAFTRLMPGGKSPAPGWAETGRLEEAGLADLVQHLRR